MIALAALAGVTAFAGPPARVVVDNAQHGGVTYPRRASIHVSVEDAAATAVPGAHVTIEADPHPYDGRWRKVGEVITDEGGVAGLEVPLRRNTRVRGVADGGVYSEEDEVVSVLPVRFVTGDARGRGTMRVTIRHPRGLHLAGRVFRFYRATAPSRRFALVASARGRRVSATTTVAHSPVFAVPDPPRKSDAAFCIRGVDLSHWGFAHGRCPGRPRYGPGPHPARPIG